MVSEPRVAAALLVVVALSAASVGGAATGAAAAGTAAADGTLQTDPDTDRTVTRVELRADGDARWTLRIRTRLATDEDVREYRAFQERFRENTSRYLDRFAERMTGVVGTAADATGRPMTAEDFAAETSIQEVPRRWGVVSYSFTWTNFAATDGDALVVGDVFEGGLYLAENDTLEVVSPADHAVVETHPRPTTNESGTVTWRGPEDFADRRPRIRTAPEGAPTATAPAGTAAGPTSTGAPTPAATSGPPAGLLAAGLLLVLLGAGAAVAYRRDDAGAVDGLLGAVGAGPPGAADARGGGADVPATVDASDDRSAGVEPDERSQAWATGAGGEPPVLTPDERVEQLLADAGGRMRQSDVAEALEWSASKTSRVVNDMAEDGRVEKLRIGRENVLELRE